MQSHFVRTLNVFFMFATLSMNSWAAPALDVPAVQCALTNLEDGKDVVVGNLVTFMRSEDLRTINSNPKSEFKTDVFTLAIFSDGAAVFGLRGTFATAPSTVNPADANKIPFTITGNGKDGDQEVANFTIGGELILDPTQGTTLSAYSGNFTFTQIDEIGLETKTELKVICQ